MCLRKKRIEELNQFVEILREQIKEVYPIKNMYDAFCLIRPDLSNRPKEVPLKLWKHYIEVIDELTTLSIEQWTEEYIKDFVDVRDLYKTRGLRAKLQVYDDCGWSDDNDSNI